MCANSMVGDTYNGRIATFIGLVNLVTSPEDRSRALRLSAPENSNQSIGYTRSLVKDLRLHDFQALRVILMLGADRLHSYH